MEPKRLDIASAFHDALAIGTKNAPAITAAVILFLLTVWIPYFNIGTLIALTLLPLKLARGERFEPLHIFRSEYRRRMGDFLLTAVLMGVTVYAGIMLLIVPGIVLSIAWMFAYYYLAEGNMNPLEAIRASYETTYGNKWRIFAVRFGFAFCAGILCLVLRTICAAIDLGLITSIVFFAFAVLVLSVGTALNAAIWKQLGNTVS